MQPLLDYPPVYPDKADVWFNLGHDYINLAARSEELCRTSAARHQAMVSGVAKVE